MRKVRIIALIIIFPLIIIIGSSFTGKKKSFPIAKEGILDLSGYKFSDTDALPLEGEWEFYYNQLLTPSDFEGNRHPKMSLYAEVPGSWNKYIIDGKKLPTYGYATYRLQINNIRCLSQLSLRIFPLHTAHKIWINGMPVDEIGKVGKTQYKSEPRKKIRILDLKKRQYTYEIIIQASNFHDILSGLTYVPEMGLSELIYGNRNRTNTINTFLIGVFIIIILYNLWLFLLRRDEKASLYFSLFCLTMTIRICIVYEYLLFHIQAPIMFEVSRKLEYLTAYFGLLFFNRYMYQSFKDIVSKKLITLVTAVCMIYVIVTLVSPCRFYAKGLYFFESFILLSALYYVYIIIRALIKKSDDAFYFLLGFIILISTILLEILHINLKMYSGYLIPFGLFTFILTQTIILSLRFSRLYLKSEKLSRELTEYSMLLENKIKARTLELEQSNEQKTTLFVNLAHEIKTPITLMDNYLNRHIEHKGSSSDLKIVKSNMSKLKKDVINYLDLEKTDRGNIIYQHDSILNLSRILKDKAGVFLDLARRKGYKLTVNVSDNLYIKASRNAMERVLNNLFDNSIKYCLKHGSIYLDVYSPDQTHHQLCIKNSSEGISPEDIEHIFKPYYQLSHHKRNTQGMGMGLAIVKTIIDEIGGTISVDSTSGDMTSFTVMLPAYHLKENDIVDAETEVESYYLNTTTVSLMEETYDEDRVTLFIVEDNHEMLAYLQSSLNKTYNVYYALNGKEALTKIKWIPKPRIIISDVMMDTMDGFEFCRALKEDDDYIDIPFIFLTAKTSGVKKLEGLNLGAIDYIYKPFVMDEVIAKINAVITQCNAQKQDNLKEFEDKIAAFLTNEPKKDYGKKLETYNLIKKEQAVIKLLNEGLEYKEIADKLDISVSTVRRRLHNVYEKCGVSNKIELINLINK